MAKHINFELRCSALLPLTEMIEAFEAAMRLVGDDEPAKAEIARRWHEAVEELSRDFAPNPGHRIAVSVARPTDGPLGRTGGDASPKSATPIPPLVGGRAGSEWRRKVYDYMNNPPVRDALRGAIEATAAYRIAQMAFVGGVPDRFVREFLRRAVVELIDR